MKEILKRLKKGLNNKTPTLALILGSGLSEAIPDIKVIKSFSYEELGMPSSIVKGHAGKFVIGEYKGEIIVILNRYHYYESGDLKKVALPFEILNNLGVKDIILLTATGGVSKNAKKGDIFLIKDHINFAPNPLIGRKDQYFVGLNDAYDKVYRNIIKEISIEENIDIKEGIHAQLTGPSYETGGELRMLETMGADTVSMSTAQDVILSNFFQMRALCFAIISNVPGEKVTHEEVLRNAEEVSKKLKILITKFIDNMINK